MSSVWLGLLKFALSVAVTAISQIPASQWALVGTTITAWLKSLEDKLPAGHPAVMAASNYRSAFSKMIAPKANDVDPWAS